MGAAAWEVEKCDRYSVTDASGRRVVPFDFEPLAFELHGRWGTRARAFVQRLAFYRSQAFGGEFSAEVARAYGIVSVGLQRANACLLLGKPLPGETQPRRKFARLTGPPDLPLAG